MDGGKHPLLSGDNKREHLRIATSVSDNVLGAHLILITILNKVGTLISPSL